MSRARKVRDSSKTRSTTSCIEKVRGFSRSRGLIEPGSRVVAAVSGGPDSMALMAILSELSREMGFDLAVAHFDHTIRREARRERDLVERSARKLAVPCFLGAGDVPAEARRMKKGIEETGRILRLRFLEETGRSWNAASVALGHTKDDNVETILHHVMRGAGWRGLQGIPARRGIFVRPLLDCSRAELKRFLRSRSIRYAIDRSNFDTRLLRNRIRIRLLPYLKRNFTPSIGETLLRLASNLSEGWETLEKPLLELIPADGPRGEVRMPLPTIAALTDFQMYLLVDLLLRDRFGVVQDIEKKHFDAAKRLIRSERSGRRIEFPHGIEALIEHSRFVLRQKGEEDAPKETFITGTGTYVLPGWKLVATVERVLSKEIDLHMRGNKTFFGAVRFPVRVRTRRPGDRIVPFGMRGRKKLSDLFIDRKVPLSRRNRIPLFEDGEGVFWVPGVAADERTRIAPGARSVIQITLSATGA
jgi:tRNA(Ile)-lysidine synthase